MKISSARNATVIGWITSIFIHLFILITLFLAGSVGGKHITPAKPLPVFEVSIAGFSSERGSPNNSIMEDVTYSSVDDVFALPSYEDKVEPIEVEALYSNTSPNVKSSDSRGYDMTNYIALGTASSREKISSGANANVSRENKGTNNGSASIAKGENGNSNGISGSYGKGGSTTTGVPGYAHNPPPIYPLEARRKGLEGLVILSVEVSADGRCSNVNIKQSSGYSALDSAATNAVKTWSFIPAMDGDTPIKSVIEIPIRFKLS